MYIYICFVVLCCVLRFVFSLFSPLSLSSRHSCSPLAVCPVHHRLLCRHRRCSTCLQSRLVNQSSCCVTYCYPIRDLSCVFKPLCPLSGRVVAFCFWFVWLSVMLSLPCASVTYVLFDVALFRYN